MIPKIIHYCWFGKTKKPEDIKKNIHTWKQQMPDYKLIEWNESNFDIENSCAFVRQAYEKRKWAFVSDYVRLKALYKYGGIYFDTDVEVFRPYDDLLDNRMVLGFESNDSVATSTMLCKGCDPFVKKFMRWYENHNFVKEDGTLRLYTNVRILTKMLKNEGLICNGKMQKIDDILILPQAYFSPNNFINIFDKYYRENYCYHHAGGSWEITHRFDALDGRLKRYIVGILRNIIGTDTLARIRG